MGTSLTPQIRHPAVHTRVFARDVIEGGAMRRSGAEVATFSASTTP
jgi:hypothetical protein